MSAPVIILIVLTLGVGVSAVCLAVVDIRADRAHAQWMARNEERRRRTSVVLAGIRRGYRGTGLDGQADRPDAMHKHTEP